MISWHGQAWNDYLYWQKNDKKILRRINELAKCDALLTEEEYSAKTPDAQTGKIDITEKGRITAKFVSKLQSQMELFASDANWSVASLVYWLDRNIPHIDIPMEDTGIFLTSLVEALIEQRSIPFEKLKDGRVVVVEYKGGHLWNDETKEMKALGELWAKRSGGNCLFVMPTDKDYAAVQRVIASG